MESKVPVPGKFLVVASAVPRNLLQVLGTAPIDVHAGGGVSVAMWSHLLIGQLVAW